MAAALQKIKEKIEDKCNVGNHLNNY